MHIFRVLFFIILFQSPAHVGDLTIQHWSNRTKKKKDIFDEFGMGREKILCTDCWMKHMTLSNEIHEFNIFAMNINSISYALIWRLSRAPHIHPFISGFFFGCILKRLLMLMWAIANRIDSWSENGRTTLHEPKCIVYIKNGRRQKKCNNNYSIWIAFISITN